MNIKIVNKKKFFRTITIILFIVMILVCFEFNDTYSRTEIKYFEEYINEGDTLWSIASEQAQTNQYFRNKDIRNIVHELKEINNISNENLNVGRKILIPII